MTMSSQVNHVIAHASDHLHKGNTITYEGKYEDLEVARASVLACNLPQSPPATISLCEFVITESQVPSLSNSNSLVRCPTSRGLVDPNFLSLPRIAIMNHGVVHCNETTSTAYVNLRSGDDFTIPLANISAEHPTSCYFLE